MKLYEQEVVRGVWGWNTLYYVAVVHILLQRKDVEWLEEHTVKIVNKRLFTAKGLILLAEACPVLVVAVVKQKLIFGLQREP